MLKLDGVFPALVTPFAGGEIDEDALRALVERLIDSGVAGLMPCGTTGESVTLEDREHRRVVRVVVEQARGRVPVIAGAGTSSTRHSIRLAEQAKAAGADGLLLVCPYYNRPTPAGLEAHFRAILAAVPLPSVLYNIPARTGVDLTVETLERLGDVREIVGIKEATGHVMRSQQILSRCGDRFVVLAGDDALTVPVLAVGGRGVVSVTANAFPSAVCRVVSLWLAGETAQAAREHRRLLPVHQAMFLETNPGPIKAVLAAAGRLRPELRAPLAWPSESTVARVRAICAAANVRPA